MPKFEDRRHSPAHVKTSREGRIRRVTWIGFVINIFLAACKFGAGYFGSSQALIADSVHSITDTVTDFAVIAGSHYWSQPPDDSHPYGHRRLETLVTVFIGLMLAAVGVGIAWEAVASLQVRHVQPPGWIALAAALLSILTKESLYRWTAVVGRQIKSPALAANAWHHRSDAVSSLPVLIAVSVALIFPSWAFIDRVGAVVVSIFILHAALRIIWPGVSELVDAGAPEEIQKKIIDIACGHQGVLEVHKVRTRYISSSIQVDMHIVVSGAITVRAGHAIADEVEARLITAIPEVVDVVIHVDPPDPEGSADAEISGGPDAICR